MTNVHTKKYLEGSKFVNRKIQIIYILYKTSKELCHLFKGTYINQLLLPLNFNFPIWPKPKKLKDIEE